MRLGRSSEAVFRHQTEQPGLINWEVIVCVTALLAVGSVMVYSATALFATESTEVIYLSGYFKKHLVSILIASVLGVAVYQVPTSFWQTYAPWIFLASLLLLVAVLVPGIGRVVKGARRWISLGPLNLQVSEVMKVAALILAAWYTVARQDYMHSFQRGFFPMAVITGTVALFVMMQPDLGATVVIIAEIMGVLFLGGLSLWIFSTVILMISAFIALMIYDTPWRLGRLFAYWDPWAPEHVLDKGYQLTHSLIAFGRGELFGVGLGGSVEKLNYLPEAHTDFIMAVIAEETGFAGVALVLFIYYWLIRRAFEIGRQAIKLEKFFQGLLAEGIGLWLGVQVFINVGVASGLLPTKGLTLPFVSFGGSALLSGFALVGLLLRVDRENKILMRGGQV